MNETQRDNFYIIYKLVDRLKDELVALEADESTERSASIKDLIKKVEEAHQQIDWRL